MPQSDMWQRGETFRLSGRVIAIPRARELLVLVAGITAWMVLFNPPVFGGGSSTTFTTSTSSSISPACPSPPFPPRCTLEGADLICVTTTTTLGPACIGVGDLDQPNVMACAGCNCGAPCAVPPFGTPFCVQPGTVNIDTSTHTTTLLCELTPAPSLSPWALAACAGLIAAYAVRRIHRSRVSA